MTKDRIRWARVYIWNWRWIREMANFAYDDYVPPGQWVEWHPRSEDDRQAYVRARFRRWYARHPIERAAVKVTPEFLTAVRDIKADPKPSATVTAIKRTAKK
jgi:hypothetical protein